MVKKLLLSFILFIFVVSSIFYNPLVSNAATVTKHNKTYEIAVVFDNSGSMYDNQAWCRAKYAMEIFASMLHYDNGDILKIFPMWAVTTDGSKPESGGSFDGIEIRSSADINKISNLYTVSPSNTPFAPISEAFQALQSSDDTEKWLIVLTDGKFNEEARGQLSSIKLQPRLSELASNNIKVQYLGIGAAENLNADEGRYFFTKKSSDTSLKDDLVNICNTIFQRAVLPNKYINGNSIKLDMSMNSLIVFAQGYDAKINGLKAVDGTEISITLNSGQRKYSTISAGKGASKDYSNAPVDTSLAGQVVTFDACPKGEYTLDYTGAEAIQIFYEPDVNIGVTLINSDGEEADFSEGVISAGEYTVNFGLIDSETGEDVTQNELMGQDVSLKGKVKPSVGEEKQIKSGGTISLEPDDATAITIEGTYLKDYKISSEDNPELAKLSELTIVPPPVKDIEVKLSSDQPDGWYHSGKNKDWEPIRAAVTIEGQPLDDAQMESVKLDLDFSKKIEYSYKVLPGESAFEINLGTDESGTFHKPKSGDYKLKAEVAAVDRYGQEMKAHDDIKFEIHPYSRMWKWLKWLVILGVMIAIAAFILTRKAWPKEMYLDYQGGLNDIDVDEEMNLASTAHPGLLPCDAKKNSMLYKRWSKYSSIKITDVKPKFDVLSFKIGQGKTYNKMSDGRYLDSSGKPFKEMVLYGPSKDLTIQVKDKGTIKGKIIMNKK